MTTQDKLALGLDHGMPGSDWGNCTDYAMLQLTWRDPRPLPSEAQILAWFAEIEEKNSRDLLRTTKRAAMREQWDGLPAWIRGPFQSLFAAANALLDAGDDEAASAMIRYAVPPSGYTPEQARAFAQVKQQFASAFAALKG